MNRQELDEKLKQSLESVNDTLNLSNELKAALESGDSERLKKVREAMKKKLAAIEAKRSNHG